MRLAQGYKILQVKILISVVILSVGKFTLLAELSNFKTSVNLDTKLVAIRIGEKAPTCELTSLNGERVKFPQEGKVNIIMYWSLFCHKCVEEMPVIVSEIQKIKNISNLSAFFISLDTEKMRIAIENFLKRRSLNCNVLLEEIASESFLSADKWGVQTTPTVFVVGTDSKIVFRREGLFSIDELMGLVRNLVDSVK